MAADIRQREIQIIVLIDVIQRLLDQRRVLGDRGGRKPFQALAVIKEKLFFQRLNIQDIVDSRRRYRDGLTILGGRSESQLHDLRQTQDEALKSKKRDVRLSDCIKNMSDNFSHFFFVQVKKRY